MKNTNLKINLGCSAEDDDEYNISLAPQVVVAMYALMTHSMEMMMMTIIINTKSIVTSYQHLLTMCSIKVSGHRLKSSGLWNCICLIQILNLLYYTGLKLGKLQNQYVRDYKYLWTDA